MSAIKFMGGTKLASKRVRPRFSFYRSAAARRPSPASRTPVRRAGWFRYCGLPGFPIRGGSKKGAWTRLPFEADRVARQHRPDPAQLAKSRRRSPDRNRLAARRSLFGEALAIGYQELHAGRPDMPARRSKPSKQRLAPRLLVEVKALRIELGRELLDAFGGEGKRAKFAPLSDLDVLEESHQPACSAAASSRRCTMIGDIISQSGSPAALLTTALRVTMPVEGRLRETLALVTSTSSINSSPGRSGASQRSSLT